MSVCKNKNKGERKIEKIDKEKERERVFPIVPFFLCRVYCTMYYTRCACKGLTLILHIVF